MKAVKGFYSVEDVDDEASIGELAQTLASQGFSFSLKFVKGGANVVIEPKEGQEAQLDALLEETGITRQL